jgi:hypothetical protein
MMKRWISGLLVALLIATAPVYGGGKDIEISGRVKLFTSMFTDDHADGMFFRHEGGQFGTRRVESRIKLSGFVNERISFNLRLDCFANGGSLAADNYFPESGVLGMPALSEHFEINLYEGNFKVTDFLIPGLDVTVGKQRIQWGSADKLNVVDNLNPIDFANFFTFDPDYAFERRPQTAINLEYYLGDVTKLQVVWLSGHQVSPLPYGYTFMTRSFNGLEDIRVNNGWEDTIGDSNYAARLSTNLLNIDWGFSYYRGNASLPVLQRLSVVDGKQASFLYPRLGVVGLDLAGELAGIGFWAEVALHLPDDVEAELVVPALLGNGTSVVSLHMPLLEPEFVKYVVGIDYNFGAGFYANLQFLHGFFDEFAYTDESQKHFGFREGMFFGELEDYLVCKLEFKTPSQSFKLGLSGIYEMGEGEALVLTPEVEAKIADGMLLQTGGFLTVSGDEGKTKFGPFKKDKIIYLGLKIDF